MLCAYNDYPYKVVINISIMLTINNFDHISQSVEKLIFKQILGQPVIVDPGHRFTMKAGWARMEMI